MLETTLGYLCKDDEVLMLHRTKKKEDINEGKWIGIGGKLETGESPKACMIRECREETGLLWKDPKLCADIDFIFYKDKKAEPFCEKMYLYTGDDFTGTLRACDEGVLRWIAWKDVGSLNLWTGDRIFLYFLRQNSPFFTMRLEYLGNTLVKAEKDGQELDLDDPRWQTI